MKRRFPLGTPYWTCGKNPRLCTVVDQLTVRNLAGQVVSTHYATQYEFLGQRIEDHNVVDATIKRGLLPEYQYLLATPPAGTGAKRSAHALGSLHFRENGDANS